MVNCIGQLDLRWNTGPSFQAAHTCCLTKFGTTMAESIARTGLHGADGTSRTMACEWWYVNGKLHRVDGPAFDGRKCYWHDVEVRQKDLPWLRRGGGGLLVALTGAGANTREQGDDSSADSPTWSRDARVVMVGGDLPETYRSAVGGAVLLCV